MRSVAFAPDGRTLATGSYDRTVRLWDVDKGIETRRLIGHEGAVESVAFALDGRFLASGSRDRTVRLWETKSVTKCESCETMPAVSVPWLFALIKNCFNLGQPGVEVVTIPYSLDELAGKKLVLDFSWQRTIRPADNFDPQLFPPMFLRKDRWPFQPKWFASDEATLGSFRFDLE